ncbi:ribonuclease III [Pacificimonas sp. ICDLI1SI03]
MNALAQWAERELGHRFTNPDLVRTALTHSSGGSGRGDNYERLEFLGDRVLGCVMAEWLYRDFHESERDMARRFATLVDKKSCAAVARQIGAADHVLIDASARNAGVHQSDNLLGDVCEALIGALYLDGGMPAATAFVRRQWTGRIGEDKAPPRDPKSQLQEWAQGRGRPLPTYRVTWREGPDHAPSFRVEVAVRGVEPVEAQGSSKQEAEKAAALAMLNREGAL